MRKHKPNAGFSLLELMVSIAVLLIVSSAAFSALNASQKLYSSQQLQVDMQDGLRGTFALMGQEIGQAGAINTAPTTISTAAVVGSATSQTVTLSSTANLFVGEQLTVDTGTAQEVVTITALPSAGKVTGIFNQDHIVSAPVVVQGVFPQGIQTTAASNTLDLFGDVNADGTLAYVEYVCTPGTVNAPGTLTRSITTIGPGVVAKNPPQILLNTVVANPGGTLCFNPSMGGGGAVTAGNCTAAFTCVTNVEVMMTVQTADRDPQIGQYRTMTKSFLNIAARNVVAAYNIATSANATAGLLQAQPSPLP